MIKVGLEVKSKVAVPGTDQNKVGSRSNAKRNEKRLRITVTTIKDSLKTTATLVALLPSINSFFTMQCYFG